MLLADTSVWVQHLRHGSERLTHALDAAEVLMHPFIVGELACGRMRNRHEILGHLERLPSAQVASHEEVLAFIERRKLMGRGIGYVDAHLLAAVTLSDCSLWTLDARLSRVAAELQLSGSYSHTG